MPWIGASVVALLAGFVIDELAQPLFGTGVTLAISFVVSTVVFFMTRRWLIELRGR